MNYPYRHPITIGTAILGVTAMCLIQARAAHACETTCTIPTYVHGHIIAVEAGDIVGIALANGAEDWSILNAINQYKSPTQPTEDFSHVFYNDYAGGQFVTENIFDENQVTKSWTCNHPIDPYDMDTVRPGVLVTAPADGNSAYTTCSGKSCRMVIQEATEITPWGTVGAGGTDITLLNTTSAGPIEANNNCNNNGGPLGGHPCTTGASGPQGAFYYLRGVSTHGCTGYALYDGYESAGGYNLEAFTHPPPVGQNGTCVDFLTSFCGVPRPPTRSYTLTQTLAATNAIYTEVYNDCTSEVGFWAGVAMELGYCSGGCDRAADEFVNTFWTGTAWDTAEFNHTTGAPVVTALNSVLVSPGALMEGFESQGRVPVPTNATNYTWTTAQGRCNVPGNCP
jgi:hypothetical protein